MSRLKYNFTQVPNSLIVSCLPVTARIVMSYLLTFQNAKSIFPSEQKIAFDCHIHESTVKRSIKILKENNYISVIGKGGRDGKSNTYIINFEEIDPSCVLEKEEWELRQITIQEEKTKKDKRELKEVLRKKKEEESRHDRSQSSPR